MSHPRRKAPAHRPEQGLLNLPSSPVVTYDTTGMVFAVALNKYSRVLMYDAKNFDKQPFTSTALNDPTLAKISFPPRPLPITSMEFSSNGSYLLVGTAGHAHYILDAYRSKAHGKARGTQRPRPVPAARCTAESAPERRGSVFHSRLEVRAERVGGREDLRVGRERAAAQADRGGREPRA
jgi:hypothetical protein